MSRIESPTLHTKRRVAASVPEQVDVAIIGAGLGGLVSGARLARAGHRVAALRRGRLCHHVFAGAEGGTVQL